VKIEPCGFVDDPLTLSVVATLPDANAWNSALSAAAGLALIKHEVAISCESQRTGAL
jgi:hypothetical protein